MTVRSLLGWLIPAWLVAILALGASGAFAATPGTPPLPILLASTLPIIAFVVAYRRWKAFHDAVLSADLRLLSSLQAWRFGGLLFLALWTYDVLPALFAIPAAIGDVTVALLAPWVALELARDPRFAASRRFAAWNVFGILDFVVALSLGALSSGVIPGLTGEVTTSAMGRMPLVLIPAFFVPLMISVHLTALLQGRRGARAHGAGYAAAAA
jgi:hypothetical protein